MGFLTDTIFSGTSFDITTFIVAVLVSIVLGLGISTVYIFTHNKSFYSKSHSLTLVMLPPIITAIIAIVVPIVGNNLASAFSIAGVFTIVRFRSAPAEPHDVAYVALALAAGLSCGLGYIWIGIIFTLIMAIMMFVLNAVNFAVPTKKTIMLKITIPEDLNFEGAFDTVLEKYTSSCNLQKVRTVDFGSLFEISYKIVMKDENSKKHLLTNCAL